MFTLRKFLGIFFVLLVVLLPFLRPELLEKTYATVSHCDAGVGPSNISPSSSETLVFDINNNGESASIVWVKITSPSDNFTITGGSKPGWSASVSGSSVTFTGGVHDIGVTTGYFVDVTAGDETPQAAWTVETSDVADGSGAITCEGTITVAISDTPADRASPNIQGEVTVTGVSATSARLTWMTDEAATSVVEYEDETAESYGSQADTNAVTSHSVTISSLLANTLYYFIIRLTDVWGNSAATGDIIFTTAAGATTTAAVTTTSTTTSTTVVKDSIAPTLSLSTSLFKPYVSAPIISGAVSDSGGINSVEYSTDGGANWTPASIKDKDSKDTTFSFSLGVLDDGNYNFQIRAKDSAGNTSEAKSYTLIIDRLPPQVGTTIFSAGPQVLSPTKEGLLISVSGLEQKITLSAVGGPTSLEVTARDNKLNLAKNVESGLWSGLIKFDAPGMYDLTTKSIDGAENETIQQLAKILVLESGKVSYLGKAISGAEVSVYVFEPTLGQFILWDGASYGQQNPQKTNENGNYSLFLPAGRYYIEAKISGFVKLRTQIFELSAPSPINADLSRESLSIPFIPNEVKIDPTKDFPADIKIEEALVGKDFPLALVKEVSGVELVSGKPQIVSFLSTWLSDTAEQIKILESLQEENLDVSIIVPQESKSAVEIYKKRGRYLVEMFSDPDGKLVESLTLRFLPAHFFLDENAKIKMIRFGILNKSELLKDIN